MIPDLGARYASLPAEIPSSEPGKTVSNPAKQALLLELCECFHPYLMKYLVMICHGHVPLYAGQVNQDIVKFIRYFMPKNTPLNERTVQIAIRHLHLAFKGMETEEI